MVRSSISQEGNGNSTRKSDVNIRARWTCTLWNDLHQKTMIPFVAPKFRILETARATSENDDNTEVSFTSD